MNQNPSSPNPLLRIEHLKKHFGNQLVLDDINLDINKGEIMCIIGQSGGGKSVVLKHVIGLIIPDGGRIVLDNEEISSPRKNPRISTRSAIASACSFRARPCSIEKT